MLKHRYFLFLALFCSTLCAQIIEKHSLADALPFLQEGALVVCDIDNTIAHPAGVPAGNHLGSDQWFSGLVESHIKAGRKPADAVADILPTYFYVMVQTDMAPVEPDAAQHIASMQAMPGVHVVGLTARSFPMIDCTLRQLTALKISFDQSSPFAHNSAIDLAFHSICKHGILFSGNNDKGAVLQAYCAHAGYAPKLVIGIDDKEKNLHALQKGCDKMGVSFIGIRYAAADAYVHSFDLPAAHAHLKEFMVRQFNMVANP